MSEIFNWRAYLKVHPAADLFPLLSPDELQVLADDIKANGLKNNVVFWRGRDLLVRHQEFELVDGRNRLDALALADLLRVEKFGDKEKLFFSKKWDGERWQNAEPGSRHLEYDDVYGDPYALALSYNVHRRHLTAEQKRELIAKVLKAKPEQSNRAIATQVKADDKTVASVRRNLETTAEIPQLSETVGIDGKKRGAQKALQTRIEKENKRREIFKTPIEKLTPEQKKWSIHDGLSQFHRQAAEARAIATRHNHLKGVTAEDVKLATSVALAWMTLADIFKDRVVADDAAASAEEMKGKFAAVDEAQP